MGIDGEGQTPTLWAGVGGRSPPPRTGGLGSAGSAPSSGARKKSACRHSLFAGAGSGDSKGFIEEAGEAGGHIGHGSEWRLGWSGSWCWNLADPRQGTLGTSSGVDKASSSLYEDGRLKELFSLLQCNRTKKHKWNLVAMKHIPLPLRSSQHMFDEQM